MLTVCPAVNVYILLTHYYFNDFFHLRYNVMISTVTLTPQLTAVTGVKPNADVAMEILRDTAGLGHVCLILFNVYTFVAFLGTLLSVFVWYRSLYYNVRVFLVSFIPVNVPRLVVISLTSECVSVPASLRKTVYCKHSYLWCGPAIAHFCCIVCLVCSLPGSTAHCLCELCTSSEFVWLC
jgi:hypothetical protein